MLRHTEPPAARRTDDALVAPCKSLWGDVKIAKQSVARCDKARAAKAARFAAEVGTSFNRNHGQPKHAPIRLR